MTNGTNGRTRRDERLPGEELLTMTTHAGIVIGKISDIGEFALCGPDCRNFVTGAAFQALMFFRRMQKV